MKIEKGFRLPESREKAIMWPDGEVAVWKSDISAWLVTGSKDAWGNTVALVHRYGNDWFQVTISEVPQAGVK